MSLFPMFVKLQGRAVVVVGAGVIAEGKIPGLLAAGAQVHVIAPEVTSQIAQWVSEAKLFWRARKFLPSDLDGASLVIAATSAPGVNHSVFAACEARGILCNAVDDIENCHFYYGAVLQRGDLQLAISTNGKSPALAQRIRKELEAAYGEAYAEWLDKLGRARDVLRAKGSGVERVKAILRRLASKEMFERFVHRARRAALRQPPVAERDVPETPWPLPAAAAKVYLVGAGPGDPELLTLRASRLLQTAQVVLHDSLVGREVLAQINPAAQIIDVGKRAGQKLLTQEEINSLLISYAQDHDIVVRLTGGDPGIFGRAGEEIEALRRANISFEIVPGITAATAAAAAAKISLTDRRLASQVLFTTFSRGTDGALIDWGVVTSSTTLVLYMPGHDYAEVSQRLLETGLPVNLPCAVVSAASLAAQKIRWSTISRLATDEKLPTPALLIVGRVARQHLGEITEQAWTALEKPLSAPAAARWI
jgi:uroporphyrin-III C-methyltransferase/precorrin-2 dehydrogenase/sirohydrochlorin ferrochelatase